MPRTALRDAVKTKRGYLILSPPDRVVSQRDSTRHGRLPSASITLALYGSPFGQALGRGSHLAGAPLVAKVRAPAAQAGLGNQPSAGSCGDLLPAHPCHDAAGVALGVEAHSG